MNRYQEVGRRDPFAFFKDPPRKKQLQEMKTTLVEAETKLALLETVMPEALPPERSRDKKAPIDVDQMKAMLSTNPELAKSVQRFVREARALIDRERSFGVQRTRLD